MLAQASMLGQKAHAVLPSWLSKRTGNDHQDTAPPPASLEQCSRASSIGSEAHDKETPSGAPDGGQMSSQAGNAPVKSEARNGRKRKAASSEAPQSQPSEQPKPRKQKLAYAAYIDTKTGQLKQIKDPPVFSWSQSPQPTDDEFAGEKVNRRSQRRMRILGGQPLRKRKRLNNSNAEGELIDWAEGEEGRPASTKEIAFPGLHGQPQNGTAKESETRTAAELQAGPSKASTMKKGPSLVNLQQLAQENPTTGSNPGTDSIFSFGKDSAFSSPKPDGTTSSLLLGNDVAAPQGPQPGAEKVKDGASQPLLQLGSTAATPQGTATPASAATTTPGNEAKPNEAGQQEPPGGQGTTVKQSTDPAQNTSQKNEQTFSFKGAALMQSGSSPSQSTSAFSFGSGSPQETKIKADPASHTLGASDGSAAPATSASGFTFGGASSPASGLTSQTAATQFSFGSVGVSAPFQPAPFAFGSSSSQAASGPSTKSTPSFSFGSAASQGTTQTAQQSIPAFSFGSGPAAVSSAAAQGAAQAMADSSKPSTANPFVQSVSPSLGGTSGGGFVFGSQPASAGSTGAGSTGSTAAAPMSFGAASLGQAAGTPSFGSFPTAFNISSSTPQGQAASTPQNSFTANQGGLTTGFGTQAQQSAAAFAQGFGSPQGQQGQANPFAGASTSSSPFSMGAAQPAGSSNPFGGGSSSPSTAFGMTTGTVPNASGASALPSNGAFGGTNAGSSGGFAFGSQTTPQAAGAFGGGSAPAPSPFGSSPQPSGFSFGASPSNAGTTAFALQSGPSGFAGTQGSNPFGSTQKAFGATPGFSFGQQQAAQSVPSMGGNMPSPGFAAGMLPGAMTMGGTGAAAPRRRLTRKRA